MASTSTTTDTVKLPPEAIAADAAIRASGKRAKAHIAKLQAAEETAGEPIKAKGRKAPAKAKKAVKRKPRAKKAVKKASPKRARVRLPKNFKTDHAKASKPNKANKPKRGRRRDKSRSDRHDGRDIVYPRTFEEGLARNAAVREHMTIQCPPAKAAGIKTTADVKQPKSEVKMKPRKSVTKTTKGRKTTAKKTATKKVATKKAATKKTASKRTPVRKVDKDATRKITVLAKKNPRKAGTLAFKRWAKLSKAKTVGSFLEATKKAGLGNCRGFLQTEITAKRVRLAK